MRIIIAGGRDFNDIELLERSCHESFSTLSEEGLLTNDVRIDIPNMEIVCGKARGADTLGEDFGKRYGIKIKYFPANWEDINIQPCKIKYNKFNKPYNSLAGHNRNKLMAEYAQKDNGVLIAFHDGKSAGTQNMINLAKEYNLKIFIIKY